jgi:hypothetical protein
VVGVVAAVRAAAEEAAALPEATRPGGDALADLYVRRAAAAAGDDAKAFLLGLAYGGEGTGAILKIPAAKAALQDVETKAEGDRRRASLGTPSLRGRADWFAHFVVSAGIVAVSGEALATTVGLGKELADLRGASGFSFADLLADDAGIAFAKWVLDPEGKGRLARVAGAFLGASYMPDATGLPDGVPAKAFERDYGTVSDPRFLALRKEVADRVKALAATW